MKLLLEETEIGARSSMIEVRNLILVRKHEAKERVSIEIVSEGIEDEGLASPKKKFNISSIIL